MIGREARREAKMVPIISAVLRAVFPTGQAGQASVKPGLACCNS